MQKSRYSFYIFLLLLIVGCTTTRVGLYTNPQGAKVYGKAIGQGRSILLGETPLLVEGVQIEKHYAGSGPIILEFKKEGFQTSTVYVTELNAIDLNVNLELAPSSGLEDLRRVDDIIDSMFRIQRLVQVKRYQEAMIGLRELKSVAPQISTIYQLEGGIFYIQRSYQDALDSYRQAIRYNPKNAEAIRMRNMLEKSYGIDRSPPATTSATAPEGEKP